MASEPIWSKRALAKLDYYSRLHGLTKNDVLMAMTSTDLRDSPVPNAYHRITYLKNKSLQVGVIHRPIEGGQHIIISCWSYRQ